MKLPYLISLASRMSGVDRYLASLAKLGNSVEWISVEFQVYPGNLNRFDYIPKDLDPQRWWIFTDTADVIFQTPIPDLDELNKTIYVAPESEIHRNNGYWTGYFERFPAARRLLDEPIYNMGAWAMKGCKALELFDYMKLHAADFKGDPCCDQALYNLWLQEQPQDIIGAHPTLMVSLYANLEKGYCRKENGVFVNQAGKPFSIVHANGNLKGWLD